MLTVLELPPKTLSEKQNSETERDHNPAALSHLFV
jgi:hypothetical protein